MKYFISFYYNVKLFVGIFVYLNVPSNPHGKNEDYAQK